MNRVQRPHRKRRKPRQKPWRPWKSAWTRANELYQDAKAKDQIDDLTYT